MDIVEDKADLFKNKRRITWASFAFLVVVGVYALVTGEIKLLETICYIFATFIAAYMGLSTAADFFAGKKGK